MNIPSVVRDLCALVREAGGKALIVGGAVRDHLLGVESKDIDVEVYGLDYNSLVVALESGGFRTDTVGAAFGVIKIKGEDIDVSIPRRDSKVSDGHKGFEVTGDPTMTPREAALRRDFTMNSIAWNPETDQLIDPFGGAKDIEAGIIRHTSDAFSEDPLRVLRGMQFAARFDFDVAEDTIALCKGLDMSELAKERVAEEWMKLVMKGRKPSKGLKFLRACGWLKFFPELEALVGVAQDPEWHPEGDVWEHTCQVCDAAVELCEGLNDFDKSTVMFAALCHDLGKPSMTEFIDGHIRSRGHEQAGDEPTRAFLGSLFLRDGQSRDNKLIEAVVPLVREHLAPATFHDQGAGTSAIRRLANRVGRIDLLCLVSRADRNGRGPLKDGGEKEDWLLEQAAAVNAVDSKPEPILQGRHLVEQGMRPGPDFGKILKAAYEAQLEGVFEDTAGAVAWLQDR